MKKSVWLDLEDSVINNWRDKDLSPSGIKVTRNFLKRNRVSEINIFSFAIDNEADRKEFVSSGLKAQLEEALEVTIKEIALADDLRKSTLKNIGVDFALWEFKCVWGKFRGFQDFCIFRRTEDIHFILIDDTVPNSVLVMERPDIVVETVNLF